MTIKRSVGLRLALAEAAVEIGYTALADTPVPDAAARRHGDRGIYAYAEHRLTGDRTDDPEGFAGWLRVGIADTRFNAIGSYLGGGIVHTGALPGRGEDQVGISFAIGICDPSVEELRTLQRQYDLHPLAVEDAIKADQLPKIDVYGDQLFVVARTAQLEQECIA